MGSRLDKSEVQAWLAGQREAEKVIEKERVASLLNRSHEESWAIYLSLTDSRLGNLPDVGKPSYVLTTMRRALERRSKRNQTTS